MFHFLGCFLNTGVAKMWRKRSGIISAVQGYILLIINLACSLYVCVKRQQTQFWIGSSQAMIDIIPSFHDWNCKFKLCCTTCDLCISFSDIREEIWCFVNGEIRKNKLFGCLCCGLQSMPTVIRGTKPTSRSFIAVGSHWRVLVRSPQRSALVVY